VIQRIGIGLAALLLSCCGYKVAGHTDLLPKTIKTIAVPAFSNGTTRYKLTDRLPEAISREFLTRTRYKVVPDNQQPDAVLNGAIVSYTAYSAVYDPNRARATSVNLRVVMRVTLTDKATGKVIFNRPNMEVSERYEVSVDPSQYFEESDIALDRASQSVARQVVSAILEDF
jgi:RNase P/RNase MRP subunit p29